jgi:hypothetical protein
MKDMLYQERLLIAFLSRYLGNLSQAQKTRWDMKTSFGLCCPKKTKPRLEVYNIGSP